MSRFTVEINLGNEAMRTERDVADALHYIEAQVRNGDLPSLEGSSPINIRDANGNLVGRYGIDVRTGSGEPGSFKRTRAPQSPMVGTIVRGRRFHDVTTGGRTEARARAFESLIGKRG